MAGRLQDRVAIITGGASGIGAATVRKFVAEGARVVLADMQVEAGEALAASHADQVLFQRTDVCIEPQVAAMIRRALDEFGRIDCLFNNAGFGGVNGDVETLDMGEPYERTVDAMLKGPIMGMKHVAPIMKEQGSGCIISTASVAGIRAGFGPHVYTAVKAAVVNLTRSVAQELGPRGIRVNAICPGGIATPIFGGQQVHQEKHRDIAGEVKPLLSVMQPIPRAGEPEDIANAACFLAGDEASFITGHALVVDGGLTLGSWMHPDLGPGIQEALSQLLGIEDMDSLDTVYHADD